MFKGLDLDGDKRCDFHEIHAAAINHNDLFCDKNIDKIFKTLDHNKNNYLEIDDFTRLMPTNLNKFGKVRYNNKGPFFEQNNKVAPDKIPEITKRWETVFKDFPRKTDNEETNKL